MAASTGLASCNHAMLLVGTSLGFKFLPFVINNYSSFENLLGMRSNTHVEPLY